MLYCYDCKWLMAGMGFNFVSSELVTKPAEGRTVTVICSNLLASS